MTTCESSTQPSPFCTAAFLNCCLDEDEIEQGIDHVKVIMRERLEVFTWWQVYN